MADYLGTIKSNCATDGVVHSRVGDCDVDLLLVKGLYITSLDFTFPTTDEAAFTAAMKAGILAGKVTPITGIEGADVTGGDIQNYATPYGTNIPMGTAPLSLAYTLTSGGSCLEKELSKLNRKERRFVWWDTQMVWCTAVSNTEGRGFIGTAMVTRTMPTNQTSPYIKLLNVAYGASFDSEWNNRAGLAVAGAMLDGLMGVTLLQTATAGQMRIVNPCSGDEVGVSFASEWAPTAFIDSAGANPESATMDADTGILTIAPTTDSYRIAPATVLDGLDIIGLDGLNELVSAAAKA